MGFRKILSKVSVISVPMNLGQPSLGLDKAPRSLIDAGLIRILSDLGWRWKQIPDIITDPNFGRDVMHRHDEDINAKNCMQVGKVSELIRNHVRTECAQDVFPLILGGDHCISIGTISAIKECRPNTAIVWVDAHGDINTPATSNSGNMHGMPVGFLMGLVNNAATLPGFQWFRPCIQPSDVVYIGLRDLDKSERHSIRNLGIKAFTMNDIDQMGIGKVMDECISYIGDRDIHLSYDIDAIDPFYAPHTGTAVTGGLTFREGNYVCEALCESGKLTSMEIVEVDPSQHKDVNPTQTIEVALTLIGSAMDVSLLPSSLESIEHEELREEASETSET